MLPQGLLYKYIGFSNGNQELDVRFSFLEDCLFRFTQPEDLKDPYEVFPAIRVGEYSREDWQVARETCKKELGTLLPDNEIEGLFLTALPKDRMDEKGFPGLWPAYDPDLKDGPISTITEYDALKVQKEVRDFTAHLNESYGIFCLSENFNSPLMWAHYAQGHRGMAIGFDQDHEFFEKEQSLFQVDYLDERISLTSVDGLLRIGGMKYKGEFNVPLSLFLRKHPEWKYELEWRMIKPLSLCDERVGSAHGNLPICLFKVPNTVIRTGGFKFQVQRVNDDAVV